MYSSISSSSSGPIQASYDLYRSKSYDFRSDTATVPTPEMKKAMMEAFVGDDLRGEDPTVIQLQKKVADLCGKEAALFVPTGTMSNQLGIRTHVTNNYKRDVVYQELICASDSHVYRYECGGLAFNSRIQVKPIQVEEGKFLTATQVEKTIYLKNDYHTPITTIVSLENTMHGDVFPLEEIAKIREVCDKHDIILHLDGARLWNACVATGIPMREYAKYFDSISLCLSKGLGAPVGSVLVGSASFIQRATQYRKLFGGAWRQAGILAAAGIYAIDHNWERMKEDHRNARYLREGLLKIGFEAQETQTNMVFANSQKLNMKWEDIIHRINAKQQNDSEKVYIEAEGYVARLVIHIQISQRGIDKLLQVLKNVIHNQSRLQLDFNYF